MTTPKLLIFTDLDGTLLDKNTYSFEPAEPALDLIRQKNIPLIISSGKTRTEIEFYREKIQNHHPFVSENGGGVFVPKDYFSYPFPYDRELDEYFVLELGTFYPVILEVLDSIKKETGIRIKGFSDLTEEELTPICGLSLKEAEFAKKREYDEPFMVEGGKREVDLIKKKIREKGMNYIWGGRFHHILGKSDKGRAIEIIKELYRKEFLFIFTVALGDNINDLPMLLAVDHPIFLMERNGSSLEIPLKNLAWFEGTGPRAWNDVIISLLNRLKI